jgi:hypothetical protein
MVLTGWTRDVLRRQPSDDVRSLMFRVSAPALVRDYAETASALRQALDTDLTKVPTNERSELRKKRTDLQARSDDLREMLGLTGG